MTLRIVIHTTFVCPGLFVRKCPLVEGLRGWACNVLLFSREVLVVVSYRFFFQDICVKIFSQDRSNKAKAETFPLLTQVCVKLPHYYAQRCHLQMSTQGCQNKPATSAFHQLSWILRRLLTARFVLGTVLQK